VRRDNQRENARRSIRKSYAADGTPVVILSNQEIDLIQKELGSRRQSIVALEPLSAIH
jgi:hypothetical protein